MTTATASKTIPQRADVQAHDTWNLADLYADDKAWEKDFKAAQTLMTKAIDFQGQLDHPARLFALLELRSELSLKVSNLYQYAHLNKDLDTRVSKYQAMDDRAAMLSAQASSALSFVEPELLKLTDDRLTELAGQFTKKDVYDLYIKELIRSRKHIRSAEVEEVLADSAMVTRAPDTIFSMLDDADFKYPSIKDENDNEVQLTKQRFARFMESPDQRVRRDANDGLNSVYAEHINGLGASLSSSVQGDLFYAKARRFESCLHHSLDAFNIPTSVYHALLDTTEANLAGLHKWMAVRKKVLKLDNLYPYDVYCPLFPELNYDVPWKEAVSNTLEAVAPLGPKYVDVLKGAFNARWVDVWETQGKSSGAYSWGNFSTHPFVLMNYSDTVNNMFTLAHEMGHAMHSYLSNTTQPYEKSQYSIFVAEVASTLNEGLLMQHLLKSADDKQKLFLLNKQLDDALGTYFHQVLYARFELMIHEEVEKGGALSPDLMNEIWQSLTEKYYGPSVTIDEYCKYKWSRIPHFYSTFYVYQYATSFAASQAILTMFLNGEEGIIDRYLTLLSSGGNDYPINQLAKCGVDMKSSKPFEDTLNLFAQQVDQLEGLAS